MAAGPAQSTQHPTSAGVVDLVSTKLPNILNGGMFYNLTAKAYGESILCELDAEDGQHNVTAHSKFYTVRLSTRSDVSCLEPRCYT